MLSIILSNQFKKDLKTAKRRGFRIEHLKTVIETLAEQKPLDKKHHDHCLSGIYHEFRECHIEPDWLLIYRIKNETLELFLFRTGTHSDLF